MQAIYGTIHGHAAVFRLEDGRFRTISRYGRVITFESERIARLCADNTDREIEANGNFHF